MSKLQFNRVGYFSNVNRMSVRYANGAKNKDADVMSEKAKLVKDFCDLYTEEENCVFDSSYNNPFGKTCIGIVTNGNPAGTVIRFTNYMREKGITDITKEFGQILRESYAMGTILYFPEISNKFSYDKLMDMNAMRTFLDEHNTALTAEMNQKFGDMFESVGYDVRVFSDGLSPQLQMITKNVLSKDMIGQCEEYLESYQKKFAKTFNKQPFTETQYGFAKFPSTNRFGIDLHHDGEKVSDQRLVIAGGDGDKYREIVAAPGFILISQEDSHLYRW